MKKMDFLRLALLVGLATQLASGCAKKPVAPEFAVAVDQPSGEAGEPTEPALNEAPIEEVVSRPEEAPGLQLINFDFDQFDLTPQAREILAGNAAYLKSHPELRVLIGGYCDERGSDEYNLALGERRSMAAENYLISLGIAPDALSTISYGEETPIVPGHDELAWAMNRRAEFNILP